MAIDLAAADLIAQQVEAGRHVQGRDESWIRLSSAGSCSRQISYRITKAEAAPEPLSALVVFEIGHAIHLRVQDWLKALGWLRPDLVEVPLLLPWEKCRGTADGITERLTKEGFPRTTGTRRVVEIKSIGNTPGEVFGKQLTGAFDRLEAPKDHHIDQATAYARAWNTLLEQWDSRRGEFPFGDYWDRSLIEEMGVHYSPVAGLRWPEDRVTHLTFVYVAKDGAQEAMPLKVFTLPVSTRRTERLVGKFQAIWQALDAGELPPRLKDAFTRYSPCSFCPYRDLCLEEFIDDEDSYTEEGQEEGEQDVPPVDLEA